MHLKLVGRVTNSDSRTVLVETPSRGYTIFNVASASFIPYAFPVLKRDVYRDNFMQGDESPYIREKE